MLTIFKLYFFITFSIIDFENINADTGDEVFQDKDPLPKNTENEEPGFNLNEAEMTKFHIWPSGVIPYFIDDFSFDKVLRDSIRVYLDSINTVTGLRFIELPRPPDDDKTRWVFFVNRIGQLGCADVSFNQFTTEGVQRIVLGYDCLASGGLAEVILALVGVPPQHNSPDRDETIQINKDNILPDKLYLFDILKDDEWLFHDLPYDLSSAGHYSSHRYTSNGGDTISIRPTGKTERQKEEVKKMSMKLGKWHKGLSTTDVNKIKMLYNYISKNREGPIEVPGCEKLFSRGPNYGNYEPSSSSKQKPRKKPKKYLQMTGEKDNESENDNNAEKYNDNEADVTQKDNNDDLETPKERDVERERANRIMLLKHFSMSQKQSQILGESDYKTGDEGQGT